MELAKVPRRRSKRRMKVTVAECRSPRCCQVPATVAPPLPLLRRSRLWLASLPLVRWRGVEPLEQLMKQCRDLGALIFNPHVLTVEGGGLGVVDGDQVATKHRYDPAGLLNPGKLGGFSS